MSVFAQKEICDYQRSSEHVVTRRGSTGRSIVLYLCTIDVRTHTGPYGVSTGALGARWDLTGPRRTAGGTVGPCLIGASPVWAARSSYWRRRSYLYQSSLTEAFWTSPTTKSASRSSQRAQPASSQPATRPAAQPPNTKGAEESIRSQSTTLPASQPVEPRQPHRGRLEGQPSDFS